MSVYLDSEVKQEILKMSDMKDGQIAIITDGCYAGKILQYIGIRNNEHRWISIGESSGSGFADNRKNDIYHPIRLLEDGEKLIISGNT